MLAQLVRLGFAMLVSFPALVPCARAQWSQPGSLLVLPEFDTRLGHITLVTVTNTNANFSGGAVLTRWHYVSGGSCTVLNRTEILQANDTLTVSAFSHYPILGQGYVYIEARDPLTGAPVAHNWLIGSVTILDGTYPATYSIPAVAFQSPLAQGQPTDLDADGNRDLDGIEYTRAPDELLFPRFVGAQPGLDSHLVLLNLSGGTAFDAVVDFLVYNDNTEVFSLQRTFHCWTRESLLALSGVFGNNFLTQTNHNIDESIVRNVESGWFRIDGNIAFSALAQIPDPAILAVLVDPTRMASADLPFSRGQQDNGDLLPTGQLGDL